MSDSPGPFALATAVSRTARSPGRVSQADPARYDASIVEGWDILGNANGGYLLAIVARACGLELDRPDPVTITGHYLSPGKPGPITVDVAPVRTGRRFATASATARSDDDRVVLAALGTFGDLSDVDGPELIDAKPPLLPPVQECAPRRPGPSAGAEPIASDFIDRVELHLHPEDAGFGVGSPSGRPRVRGWFGLPDGEPVDSLGLLCALDAFPPTVFNAELPIAWVPTIEFTAHIRCRPEPGWLACEFTTRIVSSGFLEEDGLIWDSRGRVVAQSRQLALVPRG